MRTKENSNDEILVTWKDIAAHLKCSVRKAQRLESQRLPVHRIPGTKSVWSSRSEIDQWLKAEAEKARTGAMETAGSPHARSARSSRLQPWILGIAFLPAVVASVFHAYGLTIALFGLAAALTAVLYRRIPDRQRAKGDQNERENLHVPDHKAIVRWWVWVRGV
jgi:hypothetical protein